MRAKPAPAKPGRGRFGSPMKSNAFLLLSLLLVAPYESPGLAADLSPAHSHASRKSSASPMGSMQSMEHHDHSQMDQEMEGLYGPYSITREGSGTAWQPEASPMPGAHVMRGEWGMMLHGAAYGIYDNQDSNCLALCTHLQSCRLPCPLESRNSPLFEAREKE